ncbi:MAG: efflux RND transporter periplasmic adaptor subunit [Anaerolineales bacterium]|jgi:HlyD family secretion protein
MKKQPDRSKNTRVRTWLILLVVVVVIAVISVLVIQKRNSSTVTTQYQTVQAEKGTLTATIGATGTVRANQTAVLTWQNTGTIDILKARPGDQIKAGDVLGSLLQAPLTQSTLESNLVTAQKNLAELTSSEAIANAKLAITTAQKDVTDAQTTLLNTQYWQNKALQQNYYASYVIAKDNLDKAQTAYDSAHVGEYINNANEAEAYQRLYNAKQAYDTAFYYYSVYSQTPTQRQLDEAQANLDLANATLTNARNYLAALTGGNVPADTNGTALLQLEQAKLAVQTAQENLDAAKLTAPFNGTVTEVSGMVGDQVSPGTKAFRIDDLSQMKVDVQVSEVDINSVQVGQPVTLTFDAIAGKGYTGKVVEVAQTGDSVQGAVDFNVTVVLTNADASVKPGMTAAVTITVKQLNNVLLVPSRAVRLVNNQRMVYVLINGQAQEVNVTLGASSDTMSEVVSSNLKAGDLIILNPPSTLFTRPGGNGTGGGGGPFGGGN